MPNIENYITFDHLVNSTTCMNARIHDRTLHYTSSSESSPSTTLDDPRRDDDGVCESPPSKVSTAASRRAAAPLVTCVTSPKAADNVARPTDRQKKQAT